MYRAYFFPQLLSKKKTRLIAGYLEYGFVHVITYIIFLSDNYFFKIKEDNLGTIIIQ